MTLVVTMIGMNIMITMIIIDGKYRIENRCRFVVDVTAVARAIVKGKTGIRLSPDGVASDTGSPQRPHFL